MSKYARQIGNAFALLRRKGQFVTVTRVAASTYDPSNPNPEPPDNPPEATTCASYAVVLPISADALFQFDVLEKHNPERDQDMRLVLLAGKGMPFTVRVRDFITTTEGLCRIIGLTMINPDGGAVILYRLKVILESS